MSATTSPLKSATGDQTHQPGPRIPAELLSLSMPIRYADAWELQLRLHRERVTDTRPDTILALEHRPVYTVGRLTRAEDWGGDPAALHRGGIEVQHVNRGGSVTYHGPGQLVLYPILRLAEHRIGVRANVERLEEVVLRCLRQQGITGHRKVNAPGVWVADPHEAKIASLGIRVDRGVTLHGIALNVEMDLSPFRSITPCGLQGCQITSMSEVLGKSVAIDQVKRSLLGHLQALFTLDWTSSPEMTHLHDRNTLS